MTLVERIRRSGHVLSRPRDHFRYLSFVIIDDRTVTCDFEIDLQESQDPTGV